jgi:hypothetical protein
MPLTLLNLIQETCIRTGVPKPASAIGSFDKQVQQMVGLANELVEETLTRGTWQETIRECVFTTVAGEVQGTLDSLAVYGLKYILNETIYNRTLRLPLYGPLSASEWQALKALPNAGPFYKYRIRQNTLHFNPAGVAGQICAFEYESRYAIVAEDGLTYKSQFTKDTDSIVLQEDMMRAGLRWKWKAEKGLAYDEDFRRYETMLNNNLGNDGTKRTLNMSQTRTEYRPGIFVPTGNWNLPT